MHFFVSLSTPAAFVAFQPSDPLSPFLYLFPFSFRFLIPFSLHFLFYPLPTFQPSLLMTTRTLHPPPPFTLRIILQRHLPPSSSSCPWTNVGTSHSNRTINKPRGKCSSRHALSVPSSALVSRSFTSLNCIAHGWDFMDDNVL